MDLNGRSVALYGRFTAGLRERLQREIAERGGLVARDLTGRSDVLVVGALATPLIDYGALGKRLSIAIERKVPAFGERSFLAVLSGEIVEPAKLPLSAVLASISLSNADARVLAAFDLVFIDGDKCRFGDAAVLRSAAELLDQRHSLSDIVRVLLRARDRAPEGRHKLVVTPSGEAALQWDNGLTTLEGQGFLPFDVQYADVEFLFEQAEVADARGDHDGAAALYERCANADRNDSIAPFNLGNIRLAQARFGEAANAYRRALTRDSGFVEARYNLALALEALGKLDEASEELKNVVDSDPQHSDAVFNLAQIFMKTGEIAEAKVLYERYLTLDPPSDWAATARKAITYCAAQLSR
jgi:tetratricopeptide (TPR) repeat protein